MTRLYREVEIRTPPESVWQVLTDFEAMPSWFLGVRRMRLLAPEPAEGAERILTLIHGASHRERIEEWAPEKGFSIRVLDPPFFVREWSARVAIDRSASGARVRWQMDWQSRFRRAGRLFDRAAIFPVMDFVLRRSLEKLRCRLEAAPVSASPGSAGCSIESASNVGLSVSRGLGKVQDPLSVYPCHLPEGT